MIEPIRTGNRLARCGAWMQIGFILWLIALPSTQHLRAIFQHGTAAVSPLSLLEKIALTVGCIGAIAWFAGMLALLIAVTAFRCRAKWLFAFLIICGAAILVARPFGTAFGVFFIVFALLKRKEFNR